MAVLPEDGGSKRVEGCCPYPVSLRSRHTHGYRTFSHVSCSLKSTGGGCEKAEQERICLEMNTIGVRL